MLELQEADLPEGHDVRAHAVDANQPEIVGAFRKLGCSVQILSAVGHGCPDLMIGVAKKTFAVEVKDGSKIPSKRKLTPDEQQWHDNWQGQVDVVETLDDVIRLVHSWTGYLHSV